MKRGINFKMHYYTVKSVKGKFRGPLFTHRYTVDQQAPPLGTYVRLFLIKIINHKSNESLHV